MRGPEASFPSHLCFSNYDLAKRECQNCELAAPCMDDQAGFGISVLLERCAQAIEIENASGGVPDWVMETDERIITDEDLETLRQDHPGLYREYMKFNSISEG